MHFVRKEITKPYWDVKFFETKYPQLTDIFKYEQYLVKEIEENEKKENNSKIGNEKDILINQLEILNKK